MIHLPGSANPRRDGTTTRLARGLFGSRLGHFLYTRANFSPRVLLPGLFGDSSTLNEQIHRHYLRHFPDAGHFVPEERPAESASEIRRFLEEEIRA